MTEKTMSRSDMCRSKGTHTLLEEHKCFLCGRSGEYKAVDEKNTWMCSDCYDIVVIKKTVITKRDLAGKIKAFVDELDIVPSSSSRYVISLLHKHFGNPEEDKCPLDIPACRVCEEKSAKTNNKRTLGD